MSLSVFNGSVHFDPGAFLGYSTGYLVLTNNQ